ncbi:MAG: hypothetical protein GXP39_08080 [Chloroflexi bacterium]|nr:hypothetical protein [Chloroflexota bacterium]
MDERVLQLLQDILDELRIVRTLLEQPDGRYQSHLDGRELGWRIVRAKKDLDSAREWNSLLRKRS